MLVINQRLVALCETILNNNIAVNDEHFNELIFETGINLDNLGENEWAVANNLQKKSDEICHAVGGIDRKIFH